MPTRAPASAPEPRSGSATGGSRTSASGAPANLPALWGALQQRISDRPSLGWVRYLRIERFEGDTAVLTALPGHREVLAIATPARLEPIAAELSTLRGQRTRCVIAAPEAPASRPAAAGGSEAAASGPGPFDRRAAMQVPLVRQVLEYFPDALLLEAREESAQEAASETAEETTATSDTAGDDNEND